MRLAFPAHPLGLFRTTHVVQRAFAREVHDASWGELIRQLKYKGEKAGVSVIEVKAAGTSQTCPQCGRVAKKTLKQCIYRCECGCVLDRDVAAAQVILHRGRNGSRAPQDKAA
jgi:putative transposase